MIKIRKVVLAVIVSYMLTVTVFGCTAIESKPQESITKDSDDKEVELTEYGQEVLEEEYEILSKWSYKEVEDRLDKRDTTINIDHLAVFLNNKNIETESNLLRNGYYEFHYEVGDSFEEYHERITAFGSPERLKWIIVSKNFRPDSARQLEESIEFIEDFINYTFPDWERGERWLYENLEINETASTYFEHEDEYISISASVTSIFDDYARASLVVQSAE